MNFVLITKLLLICYLWFLISLCAFFIFRSLRIYKKLKAVEVYCTKNRRNVVHNFVPFLLQLSFINKNIQTVFNLNRGSFKDFIPLTMSFILNNFGLVLGTRFGFKFLKKLLR